MPKGMLLSELFYCDHLGACENDERDIMKAELHTRLKPDYDESCVFMYRML